jgi:hypothetical protein
MDDLRDGRMGSTANDKNYIGCSLPVAAVTAASAVTTA